MGHHAPDRGQRLTPAVAGDGNPLATRATAGDTIAAVATAPGRGAIGIVRISGPATRGVADRLLAGVPPARAAAYRAFHDARGAVLDRGIALFFPGPDSYTGEDVLELQGHGGPVVMDLLLAAALGAGARAAQPGEFTLRAFLNDRIDLARAEAVADLIDASTAAAARSAVRSLDGALSHAVERINDDLVDLRAFVEAAIDFPDEEIDFLSDGGVAHRLAALRGALDDVLAGARQGRLLREGMTVVIAGRPNVGKSSLLNRLTGRDAAIVTEVPGTTRDVLREPISIDGLPLHVVDTAGLRDTDDVVERLGVDRARDAIGRADLVALVVEDAVGVGPAERAILAGIDADLPVLVVRNKIDLGDGCGSPEPDGVRVSARTGAGMDELRAALRHAVGYEHESAGAFMARRRHVEALEAAAAAFDSGAAALSERGAGELLAEDLRSAQRALGAISGAVTDDDLLDRIFAGFCIGK